MKEDAKNVSFTKDRPFVFVMVVNGALMLLNVLSVVIRLRPNDFKIPVQYIVYDGTVVQTGNWYSLYSLVLFVVFGGIATVMMSQRLHKANRPFAMAALISYGFVALFSLFAINALLGLVSRV